MANDRDRFYEDELEFNSAGTHADTEPMDDTRYFLELLKSIRALVETSKSVPLMRNKKMIDIDEITMMLTDLESNLPDAIQYGNQMYADRERIMGNAENSAMTRITSAEMQAQATIKDAETRADQILDDAQEKADAIIADAEERAAAMVEESEIVIRAQEEAANIKNSALIQASEIKLKARHDARQTVAAAEDELQAALNNISRRRRELDEALE